MSGDLSFMDAPAGEVVWHRRPWVLGSANLRWDDNNASSSAMATVVSLHGLGPSLSASYAVKSTGPEGTKEFALQIHSDSEVLASIDMDGNLTVSDDLSTADVVKLLYAHMQHATPRGHAAHMSKPMPSVFKSASEE